MGSLGIEIERGNAGAVPGFRRMHVAAVSVNVVQLVLIVWGLVALSMQLR